MKQTKKHIRNPEIRRINQAIKNLELQIISSTSPKFGGNWFYQVKKPSDKI